MKDIVQNIIGWTKSNCVQGESGLVVNEDTPLLENSLLDSMDFLKLVAFLEEQHEIKIDTDDMTPENFETPKSIAVLVERQLSASS